MPPPTTDAGAQEFDELAGRRQAMRASQDGSYTQGVEFGELRVRVSALETRLVQRDAHQDSILAQLGKKVDEVYDFFSDFKEREEEKRIAAEKRDKKQDQAITVGITILIALAASQVPSLAAAVFGSVSSQQMVLYRALALVVIVGLIGIAIWARRGNLP